MYETITATTSPVLAESWSARDRIEAMVSMLREADALICSAIELLGRGGIEAATGMPPELVLSYEARRTAGEAAVILYAAGALRDMPHLAAAFKAGHVSWGQVRQIVYAIKPLRLQDRQELDAWIGEFGASLLKSDPEALLESVDREVERRRDDIQLAREDRAIKGNFLSIQPRFDGGSTIYGEADAESTATIVDALDAVADAPVHADEGISRAQQHLDALVHICENTLAGGTVELRPRPRLYATFDLAGLADQARDQGMILLTALTGRSPRLSKVSRDTLLCDASIIPVIFDGPTPTLVGDESTTFSNKARSAIMARDKRCRFCRRAPASWCDVHHLVPGVGRTVSDGCLLCRTCHRRVHRFGWAMRMLDDGAIEFNRHGETFLSLPP